MNQPPKSEADEDTHDETLKPNDTQRWIAENKEAFDAANAAIDRYGIFNIDDREW